jgi:hypothetical protein
MGLGLWHLAFLCRFTLSSSCFIIFPFPVNTAQFLGKFWKTRRSAMSDVALHLLRRYIESLLALRCFLQLNVEFTAPLEVFADFFMLHFVYWWRTIRGTSSIGAA